ncbi:unc-13-like 3 [Homarus americanus]|uniref:Unc-13-like 3 n=1 Tax=Homarus americanus TaxID=6706 RepID=A0A8J5MVF6_HOMAM|nr:unc-13-like 3 [Homarus americanus]
MSSAAVTTVMEGSRSAQEMTALRDVAYVICFGHFPCEDDACAPNHQRKAVNLEHTSVDTFNISVSSEPSISSDDPNPFSDDMNPFTEDQNPFKDDDRNPFTEDQNPFNEDDDIPGEDGDQNTSSEHQTSLKESSVSSQKSHTSNQSITKPPTTPEKGHTDYPQVHATPATPPESPPPREVSSNSSPLPTPPPVDPSKSPPLPPTPSITTPSKTQDASTVSRAYVKEVIAEAFNLTPLDLRRMVEETGNKHSQIFLIGGADGGAAPGGDKHGRSCPGTHDRDVNNMYTQTLLLQVWRAVSLPVEETQSGPVLDFLGRLITSSIRHKKDKSDTAAGALRSTDESSISATTIREHQEESPSGDTVEDGDKKQVEHNDEVDHCDEIPIINVSVWENKNQEGQQDTPKTIKQKMSPKTVQAKAKNLVNKVGNVKHVKENNDNKVPIGNDVEEELPNGVEVGWEETNSYPLDASDTVSVSSELSPDVMRASTPRGRSASFQSLELSSIRDSSASKKSIKNKLRNGSLKISASNLKTTLRSSFRRGHQNNSVDSKTSQKGQPDNFSLRSENSDISCSGNPLGEEEEADNTNSFKDDIGYHEELPNENGHNKLNREKSKSTLSIASISERMNTTLRLSSQKATNMFKRIGSKRGKKPYSETSTPELSRRQPQDDNTSISSFHMDKVTGEDQSGTLPSQYDCSIDDTSTERSESHHSREVTDGSPMVTAYLRKSFRTKFSTPRTLRAFRSLRERGNTKKHIDPKDNNNENISEECERSLEGPQNSPEIQSYLSSIDKGHLKAELLAHVSVPLKTLIGPWKKEGWFPLIVTQDENSSHSQKKKKFKRAGTSNTSLVNKKSARMACKLHIRLTLPTPESGLTYSGYDTYSTTLRKLVDVHIQALDSLKDYKGSVGAVGDVLLQQLVFFSRVSEPHRTLAKWLIMVDVKPSDPGLFLPLLRAIRTHLEAGLYLTTQKRQLGGALSSWVRKVLTDEFEMLHSSFPSNSDLIELSRLENFLRVEALNKEKLKHGSDTSLTPHSQVSAAWLEWQEAQWRASLLTKPILNFLTISFHTYQPIFMVEMSVDYLYLVMPKMLTATLHLVNPLMKYDVDGANQVPLEAIPSAAQAGWVLCTNLSQINKIGIESHLPQHLIPQEYRNAFSLTLLHWLALSKHLALEEFHRDIQHDKFVAIDDLEGYSRSAVGVADLLKALMTRVCDVRWPGGVGPGGNTLTKISQQIIELAAEYTDKVTKAFVKRDGDADRISKEVCVVVRNVEHVCDEVRKHLLHLASILRDEKEVAQQLEERTKHLQEHIDFAAEFLLHQCLPHLEQILTQGVVRGSSEFVLKGLELAMQPVEDRLYFAEPLLHQMWFRLFQHATILMSNYVQGEWRENLRKLRTVLSDTHSFLTDQGVGLRLPDEVEKEYESVQAELMILGATSPELMSQFYHERYQEQLKEGSSAGRILVVNSTFTEGGLRVHVVQAPGVPGGVLVKARVEPHEWFPAAEPCKTRLSKGDPSVFNEIFKFPSIQEDHSEGEQGGVLTLQVRTPRILGSSVVHYEAVLPLANLPRVLEADVLTIQHSRLPLTRPWKLTSYKPLEALKTRALDKTAVDFLKALSERWEPRETSVQIQDSQKLRATFARAGSVRNTMKGSRKPSLRGTLIK